VYLCLGKSNVEKMKDKQGIKSLPKALDLKLKINFKNWAEQTSVDREPENMVYLSANNGLMPSIAEVII
jgi:hypothetical protein